MEGFSSQHEQQLHHSSALPYCFLSEPRPLPVPGFPASSNLEAAAAMAYESSSSSSLSMVYSPVLLQLQESRPSFETAAAAGDKRSRVVAIEGSSTTSLGSAQEMDGGGGKSRKQRTSNVGVKGLQEKNARGHGDVKAKEAGGEPPAGYIHVRARRGQATDSHSLAERLRREKISERMKMLQSLVPGCDKVTGKALMLDEIISYVQSLQNQVEFLSMKLASLNPVMYEFGLDIDMYPNVPQVLKMAQMPHELAQCMGQGNQLPTCAPHTGTSLEEAQGPTGFAQDGGSSSTMQVGGEQGQEEGSLSLHQVEFSSMCFFQ